jgi:prophage regulatory protein
MFAIKRCAHRDEGRNRCERNHIEAGQLAFTQVKLLEAVNLLFDIPRNSEVTLTGPRFLRMKEVRAKTGLANSTIYKRMSEETFPQSRKIGGGSVRWLQSDTDTWMKSGS